MLLGYGRRVLNCTLVHVEQGMFGGNFYWFGLVTCGILDLKWESDTLSVINKG